MLNVITIITVITIAAARAVITIITTQPTNKGLDIDEFPNHRKPLEVGSNRSLWR